MSWMVTSWCSATPVTHSTVCSHGGVLMNPSEFLKYIADHPDLKPSAAFEAYGGRESDPSPRPTVLPRGRVFTYPAYFAFLTTRHFTGGWQLYGEEVGHNLTDYALNVLKVHRWMIHPASIAVDISRALGNKYRSPEAISKAVTNQNSFFFPLSELKDVVAGGGIASGIRHKDFREANSMPYFRLTTRDETYVVRMVPKVFWNYDILKGFYQQTTSRWQPRALEVLRAAAPKDTGVS